MIKYGIITHGGVGSPNEWSDGCEKAAKEGEEILKEGGSALDAVVAAATILENDGRFNAGCGSDLRLDGKTIECDAAIMDSYGNIGSVINVQNVKNPTRLAGIVLKTPHVAIAGRGAEQLSSKYGLFGKFKPTERAIDKHKKIIEKIRSKTLSDSRKAWLDMDIDSIWNFESNYNDLLSCDTIGAVALDKKGSMAVACSTGGASPTLLGRVGDSPLPGAGFYCGQHGAICSTGIGEEIIRHMLAINAYNDLKAGNPVKEVIEKYIKNFPSNVPAGLIAISPYGYAVSANRQMAACVVISE